MANRFLSNIRINDAYTFPASDGTNNQVIKTDGSGNLSFGQLAADSASVMYKDTFTGDGSTTGFSLANALNDEVQSNIYIDGVYQSKSTYSVSGTTVTFSTAPSSGHEIEVISTTGINSGPTAIYTDTFTANGSATAFTLGQTVHDENQTIVFLNGVYQFKGTYTLSGTTLTLDTAPANGVAIEVMSIGSAYSGGDILYDHDFTSAGLMTTNGSGVYSITANNSANWNTAYGWGDHSTQSYATQSYVGTQISNLVDSSPATLNTLNELAAALGDDPNFATTTANSIGTKLPLAGGTLTGGLTGTTANFSGNVTIGTGIIKPNIGGDIAITQGAIGLRINDAASAISPTTATSNNDNAVDLGVSNIRFRNLYMGGTGTFGGTVTISQPTNGAEAKLILTSKSAAGNSRTGIIEYDADVEKIFFINEGTTIAAMTSDGKVGIGTDSPTSKLHLRDPGTNSDVGIKIGNDSRDWNLKVMGSVSDSLQFFTHDNSNVMTILPSGNVGIGVNDPQAKLEVKGTSASPADGNEVISVTNTTGGSKLLLGVAENSYGWIQSVEGSTYRNLLLNPLGGNVGIGTTSPNDKLEVSGGNIRIYSTSNANHLIIKNNATATSGTFEERIKFLGWNDSENAAITGIGNAYFGSPVNALAFSVSGVEAIRIKHGGQVRIGDGDSEQLAAIRLGGENAAGGRLYFEYNGDNSYIDSYGGHGSTQRYRDLTFAARNLIFTTGNTGGSEKMRISDAGDVSVNDTSANNCTLHINSYQKNAGNAARIGNMQICMEGNGSAYPNIGYGQRSTTSTTGFVYQQSDTASWFRFHAGGIQSYTAPSGTSGAAINFTTGPYVSQGGTSWTSGSDINLKENIKPLNKVLDKIKDYRCVEYSLKSDANKSKKIGFIAQDWEQDFAQVIEKDNEENLGIKYSETIPVLLKAIQELKADNDSLKARIETLENN